MTKYPLIEAMGLNWCKGRFETAAGNLSKPFDIILCEDVERMLAEAPVVYGVPNAFFSHVEGEIGGNGQPDTHTARLICIQPIRQDTAESLLKEFVDLDADSLLGNEPLSKIGDRHRNLVKKARKLLEARL
jgi:hypothetical protein